MSTTFTANLGLDKPAQGDTGWGSLRNTNVDDIDAEIVKPRILQSALTWGATTTVDLSLARVFTGTNSQITTIAFSNVPSTFPNGAVVPVVRCDLIITNGGAFAITWPGSVTWLAGVAPGLNPSGTDIVRLVTRDGGTTWYGAVVAITQQACRLFKSAAQSIGSGAAYTDLTFNSETFDQGGLHDTGANTERITIAIPGLYLLYGQVEWAANATGLRSIVIEKNDDGASVGTSFMEPPQTLAFTQNVQTLAVAVKNDYFKLLVAQISGGALNVNPGTASTYFMAVRLW